MTKEQKNRIWFNDFCRNSNNNSKFKNAKSFLDLRRTRLDWHVYYREKISGKRRSGRKDSILFYNLMGDVEARWYFRGNDISFDLANEKFFIIPI